MTRVLLLQTIWCTTEVAIPICISFLIYSARSKSMSDLFAVVISVQLKINVVECLKSFAMVDEKLFLFCFA